MAFKKIGALWVKNGKKGRFLSGEIEVDGSRISVMVFKNEKGENPKRPDYTVNVMVEDGVAGDQEKRWENETGSKPPVDDEIPF